MVSKWLFIFHLSCLYSNWKIVQLYRLSSKKRKAIVFSKVCCLKIKHSVKKIIVFFTVFFQNPLENSFVLSEKTIVFFKFVQTILNFWFLFFPPSLTKQYFFSEWNHRSRKMSFVLKKIRFLTKTMPTSTL